MITLTRDSGWADRLRPYLILIDNCKVAKIGDGECLEIPLSPGNHEIYLKLDWGRSNKINFEMVSGEILYFHGRSNLRGIRLLLSFIFAIFLPSKWIILERTNMKPAKENLIDNSLSSKGLKKGESKGYYIFSAILLVSFISSIFVTLNGNIPVKIGLAISILFAICMGVTAYLGYKKQL